jgi:hypothetical protein
MRITYTRIESEEPLFFGSCDGCGETSNEWYEGVSEDGHRFDTIICSYCAERLTNLY